MDKSLIEKRDRLAEQVARDNQHDEHISRGVLEDIFSFGFDSGVQAERERSKGLVDVLKKVYLKHNLGDDSIGWEELGTIVHSTICNEIGDDAFCDWLEQYKAGGE
jgi:hypothetical protein